MRRPMGWAGAARLWGSLSLGTTLGALVALVGWFAWDVDAGAQEVFFLPEEPLVLRKERPGSLVAAAPVASPPVASPVPTVQETPFASLATPAPASTGGETAYVDFIRRIRGSEWASAGNSLPVPAQASTPRARLAATLGLARSQLRSGAIAAAEATLLAGEPLARTAHDALKTSFALISAELLEKKNELGRAVDLLAPLALGSPGVLQQEVIRTYFRALVAAGDTAKAVSLWKLHPRTIVGATNEAGLDGALLELAAKLEREGSLALAREALTVLARKFPVTEESRVAFQKLGASECDVQKDIFGGSAAETRALALRLVRDFGQRADLRQLGLALAGIDEKALVPTVPVDSLSESERLRLMDAVEFLLQAWEYKLALPILDYLRAATVSSGALRRDRFLFLHGRALNQLERYGDAAKAYVELITSDPASPLRSAVRERLLLSFHYAGRYEEELKWMERLARGRSSLVDWDYFWALYLAGRNDAAMQAGGALLSRARKSQTLPIVPRLSYWMARIEEKRGNRERAKSLLKQLAATHGMSHYAVWARWRLEVLSGKEPRGFRALELEPSGSVAWPPPYEYEEIDLARELVGAGLNEVALSLFDVYEFGPGTFSPAMAAFLSGKFRYALVRADDRLRSELRSPVSETSLRTDLEARPLLWQLSYPLVYQRTLAQAEALLGGNDAFVLSIMRAESMFNAAAVSSVGALGLMQIMPRTGQHIARLVGDTEFSPTHLLRPEINVAYGAWYLQRLQQYYRGNYVLAAAAYNAGPAAVDRWMRQAPGLEIDEFAENIPYDQTHAYIGKILRNLDLYLRVHGKEHAGLSLGLPRALPAPIPGMEMF